MERTGRHGKEREARENARVDRVPHETRADDPTEREVPPTQSLGALAGNAALSRWSRSQLHGGGPADMGITSASVGTQRWAGWAAAEHQADRIAATRPPRRPVPHPAFDDHGSTVPDAMLDALGFSVLLEQGEARAHVGPQSAAAARRLGARAFTVGGDIWFNDGQYDVGSEAGRQLISHELAHVAQQKQSNVTVMQLKEDPQAPPPRLTDLLTWEAGTVLFVDLTIAVVQVIVEERDVEQDHVKLEVIVSQDVLDVIAGSFDIDAIRQAIADHPEVPEWSAGLLASILSPLIMGTLRNASETGLEISVHLDLSGGELGADVMDDDEGAIPSRLVGVTPMLSVQLPESVNGLAVPEGLRAFEIQGDPSRQRLWRQGEGLRMGASPASSLYLEHGLEGSRIGADAHEMPMVEVGRVYDYLPMFIPESLPDLTSSVSDIRVEVELPGVGASLTEALVDLVLWVTGNPSLEDGRDERELEPIERSLDAISSVRAGLYLRWDAGDMLLVPDLTYEVRAPLWDMELFASISAGAPVAIPDADTELSAEFEFDLDLGLLLPDASSLRFDVDDLSIRGNLPWLGSGDDQVQLRHYTALEFVESLGLESGLQLYVRGDENGFPELDLYGGLHTGGRRFEEDQLGAVGGGDLLFEIPDIADVGMGMDLSQVLFEPDRSIDVAGTFLLRIDFGR